MVNCINKYEKEGEREKERGSAYHREGPRPREQGDDQHGREDLEQRLRHAAALEEHLGSVKEAGSARDEGEEGEGRGREGREEAIRQDVKPAVE